MRKAPLSRPSADSVAAVKASREKRRAYLDAHAGEADPAHDTPTDAELVARSRRVERFVREGMARRFAEQEVAVSTASSSEARPASRSDPPGDPPEAPLALEIHPLDCECLECSCRAPQYAKAWSAT